MIILIYPFVKIKSFPLYSNPLYIKQLIKSRTNYPLSLIENYFSNIYDPSSSFKIENKTFNPELYLINNTNTFLPKIAIHINTDNPIILEKYICILDKFDIEYHLFITTDTEEKKKEIIDFMQGHSSCKHLKEIIVYKYYDQNILLWLNIAERLKNYEIVGNFFISDNVYEIQDNVELFFKSINKIIEFLNANIKIGILIPDIPEFLLLPLMSSKEKKIKLRMDKLWREMNLKKEIKFQDLSMLIFSYGNMFWYRTTALYPLVDFYLKNISKNYLFKSKFALECLNRMLVYIAWSEGYDYRICTSKANEESIFYCYQIMNNYVKKYLSLNDYKIGRLIFYFKRFLKNIKRKIKKLFL